MRTLTADVRGLMATAALTALALVGAGLGRPLLVGLAVALLTLLAASHLWRRWALRGVRYRRTLGATHLAPGEETTLTIDVTNDKPLPLGWLLVHDALPRGVALLDEAIPAGAPEPRGLLTTLSAPGAYGRVQRTYRLAARERGVHRLGPAELTSGDLLGLGEAHRALAATDTLTVYPRLLPLDALGLPPGRPLGDWFSARRILDDPLRYSAIRGYRQGDNPRYIHWRATAHTGSLQVKVFDPTEAAMLAIALDARTRRGAGPAVPEHLEYAISVAATLALRGLDEGYHTGLWANALGPSGATSVHAPVCRDARQAHRLLTLLAGLDGACGVPLAEILDRLGRSLAGAASIVAISAAPTAEVYEALYALERRGHRALLVVIGDEVHVPAVIEARFLGGRDAWHRLATAAV